MKKFFNYILTDRIALWEFITSILCIVISIIIIGVFYTSLPPFIPLYNKMPWGYERIGSKIQFFIPIFITAVIVVTNAILSSLIYKKITLLSRLLSATTVIICLSLLIFVIQIILLVK